MIDNGTVEAWLEQTKGDVDEDELDAEIETADKLYHKLLTSAAYERRSQHRKAALNKLHLARVVLVRWQGLIGLRYKNDTRHLGQRYANLEIIETRYEAPLQ